MNLYDWLKEKDNDYDTYDTVYDICVTVCVSYEGLSPEWYDKFSDFVLKHVDVIEETSDYECIADWNKFIEDNAETFKKITEDSWSYMPDDEDFNYEWISEIDKLLTGYGSEKTYHYLMDMFTRNIKEDISMITQDINWTIRFTRLFKGHILALDIVEYLINNNGEYVGSYYTFAEELRGDRNAASNVRAACIWLKSKGIAYAQSTKGKDDYNTVIVMDANWKENI